MKKLLLILLFASVGLYGQSSIKVCKAPPSQYETLFEDNAEGGTIVPPWTTEIDDVAGFALNNNTVFPHSGSRSLEIFYNICRLTGTPAAPTLSDVACSGSGGDRFVKYTYATPGNSAWEHRALSSEASRTVASGRCLKITAPAAVTGLHFYYAWVSTSTGNETIQNGASGIPLGTDWTEPDSGLVSGATPGISPCPTGSSDNNKYPRYTIPSSPTTLHARGYFYFKTPQNGGTVNGIQRKIMWWQPSDGLWSFFLTSDSSAGVIPLRFSTNGSAGCTVTADSDWNIATLNYDTWYNLEIEIRLNTPGSSDGGYTLWVNGSQVATSSTWNLRGTCTTGIDNFRAGLQVNSGGGSDPVEELHYVDDVVLALGYIGP